jgi:hypothetical protein
MQPAYNNLNDELNWSMLEGMIHVFYDNPSMKRLFVPSTTRFNGKMGIITTDINDPEIRAMDFSKVDVLYFNLDTKEMTRLV